jgi:acetyl esterase/lipase
MGAYTSWGRLMATSGMVAVTYTNRDPVLDAQSLLQYIRQNANRLGIDEHRIGLWACSGNVPLALSMLMKQEINKYVKCAVLCYGFMLDLDGSDIVVKAAKLWGFVNSCAGKSVEDLPQGVPLLIVRAGLDQTPHLNETIDQFLPKALSKNLPITLANHAAAPHGFDLLDESDLTRGVIRGILAFMRFHLLGRF